MAAYCLKCMHFILRHFNQFVIYGYVKEILQKISDMVFIVVITTRIGCRNLPL